MMLLLWLHAQLCIHQYVTAITSNLYVSVFMQPLSVLKPDFPVVLQSAFSPVDSMLLAVLGQQAATVYRLDPETGATKAIPSITTVSACAWGLWLQPAKPEHAWHGIQ